MADNPTTPGPEGRSWFRRILGKSGQTPVAPAAAPAVPASPQLSIEADALDLLRVADVMVPRADIIGVEVSTPLDELAQRFAEAAHSRLPIYRETLDDPVGVAHIKDVVGHLAPSEDGERLPGWLQKQILPAISRPLLFAPPSMRASDLLRRMQGRRMHMALVVDEYGGTDGLVTLEDLIEPIVGDIEDEHDESEASMLRAIDDDSFMADARVELTDLIEAIGSDFDPGEYAEEVDTLGGLIFAMLGRVPVRGEVVSRLKGFEFEITRADARRVKQVRITRRRRKQRLLIAGPKSEAPVQTETGNQQAAE